MRSMSKRLAITLAAIMMLTAITGCALGSTISKSPVYVISREEGSGTRSAFVELFGVQVKDESGKNVDNTIDTAEITNSTAVMMTSVAGDPTAIGYISLGSLNDTVKALKIDGVEATADNIKSGAYPISRPFNIVTLGEVGDAARDFINFILSDEGQEVVQKGGYIKLDDTTPFESTSPAGKIVVAGSSSVTPIMEKLREAYIALNPSLTIEIQESDSTTGVNSTIDRICDIGMASRELKSSEVEKGCQQLQIATDGLAVIVNHSNELTDITRDEVRQIYVGEITLWSEIK